MNEIFVCFVIFRHLLVQQFCSYILSVPMRYRIQLIFQRFLRVFQLLFVLHRNDNRGSIYSCTYQLSVQQSKGITLVIPITQSWFSLIPTSWYIYRNSCSLKAKSPSTVLSLLKNVSSDIQRCYTFVLDVENKHGNVYQKLFIDSMAFSSAVLLDTFS